MRDIKNGECVIKITDELAFRDCRKTGHCSKKIYPTASELEQYVEAAKEIVGYADFNIPEQMARCLQDYIHWHCAQHKEFELVKRNKTFICPECDRLSREQNGEYNGIEFNEQEMKDLANSIINTGYLRSLELVKINDFYVPQTKREKIKNDKYFIESSFKEDRYGNTIGMILIGECCQNGEKAQLFIKPSKEEFSYDQKDKSLRSLLSKIQITFRNSAVTQDYGGEVKDEK